MSRRDDGLMVVVRDEVDQDIAESRQFGYIAVFMAAVGLALALSGSLCLNQRLSSLAVSPQPVCEGAHDSELAYTSIYQASVRVKVWDGWGSGCAVTNLLGRPDVYIITAGHVCESVGERVELDRYCPALGVGEKTYGKVIMSCLEPWPSKVDVAVIRPENPELFTPIPLESATPRLGEIVALAGVADGSMVGLTLGHYRGMGNADVCEEVGFPVVYFVNVAVNPGASGSSVFVIRGGRPRFIGLLNWGSGSREGSHRWVLDAASVFKALDPLGN